LFFKGFFTTEHTENTEKTIKKSLPSRTGVPPLLAARTVWALWFPWSKLLIIARNGIKKHSLSLFSFDDNQVAPVRVAQNELAVGRRIDPAV
jgi:hypothetical protein